LFLSRKIVSLQIYLEILTNFLTIDPIHLEESHSSLQNFNSLYFVWWFNSLVMKDSSNADFFEPIVSFYFSFYWLQSYYFNLIQIIKINILLPSNEPLSQILHNYFRFKLRSYNLKEYEITEAFSLHLHRLSMLYPSNKPKLHRTHIGHWFLSDSSVLKNIYIFHTITLITPIEYRFLFRCSMASERPSSEAHNKPQHRKFIQPEVFGWE